MQRSWVSLSFVGGFLTHVAATQSNPLSKVLDLLSELESKITKDGEAEAKAYHEYFEWCDDVAKNTDFAIETAEREEAGLEAKIDQLTSKISVANTNIDELAGSIASSEAELKNATLIRDKEIGEFEQSEAELVSSIDTLSRAIVILTKEMAKNPAAFSQINSQNLDGAMQAVTAILDAASFPGKDQSKLAAFVQSQQKDDDRDLDIDAPAGATYKTHSSGILDVLDDLKEKAEGQLSDLRKAEVNTQHNFDMLKQSLEDQISADSKDKDDEAKDRSEAEQSRATATCELKVTKQELASSKSQLETAHSTCLQVASDHEATVSGRKEELATLAEAKKTLTETSSGAESQTYSFVQVSSKSRGALAGSEVVSVVKKLAKEHHSAALAQLASRITTVLRFSSSSGEDPFGKVKGLIVDMIAKLQKEAGDEASEKAYCDEQIAKTEAKKAELEEDIARMTSRIDRAAAKSVQLKEEIQVLESELAALAKEQAELDAIRHESHADYTVAKADLELGLSGVRQALSTLRDYYGGAAMLQDDSKFGTFMQQPAKPVTFEKAVGAGGSIINILQVVESDFAQNLAKEEMEEANAQSEYEKVTQENSVTKTIKDQDVKYKTQESKALDKTAAEYSSDRETANSELSAVLSYYSKIKDRCIAKPETYAQRKALRESEIDGLKSALSILEDETAFVQRPRRGVNFRGSLSL